MPSSAQNPYELIYFTASPEESDDINDYVDSFGENSLVFYASFINYCISQAGARNNPSSKNKKPADYERMMHTVNTLRQRPLTAKSFIDLMERYLKHSYRNGNIIRGRAKPEEKNLVNINHAQEELKRQLFSTSELMKLWLAAGKKREDFGNKHQSERNKARMAKSVARRKEAVGGGMRAVGKQISEIEKEIEAEDAGCEDVKEAQGWESELPIRGEKQ